MEKNLKIQELLSIIKNEELTGYNLKMDGTLSPNEVVLYMKDDKWAVGIADERASIISMSERLFNDEDTACQDFLTRLRSTNKIRKLREKVFGGGINHVRKS